MKVKNKQTNKQPNNKQQQQQQKKTKNKNCLWVSLKTLSHNGYCWCIINIGLLIYLFDKIYPSSPISDVGVTQGSEPFEIHYINYSVC